MGKGGSPGKRRAMSTSNLQRRTSEIRSDALDFPITVTRWLRASRTARFLRPRGRREALAFGAEGCGFGKGALGGRRQPPHRRFLIRRIGRGRAVGGRALDWHEL